MKRLGFGFVLLATLSACDTSERCVANCDEGSTSEGGVTTEPQGSDGTSSGGTALTCEEVTTQADAYIESHRACETLLDCETDWNVCFPPASVPGTVALSSDALTNEWIEIADALSEVCPCEDPVSAGALCTDAGECEAFNAETDVGRQEFCATVSGDVETFLAANTSCTVNADCVAVESACHVDECSVTALNTQASIMDWARLDEAGVGCTVGNGPGAECNLEAACAAGVECSDQGVCLAVL